MARAPLGVSLALHGLVLLSLSPGHHEGHTVQLFKGVVELGEAGDGHAERPHVHAAAQRQKRAETESTQSHPTVEEGAASGPIDVTFPTGAAGGTAADLDEAGIYLLGVLRKIQSARAYPREALLREEEGEVVVSLTLSPDGSVSALELAKSSPFQSLNRAAVDSVRSAAPFAALPAIWTRPIRIRVPLRYELEGR